VQEQGLVQELEQLVQVQVWRGPGDQGVSAPRATTPCSTSPSLGPRRAQGLRRSSLVDEVPPQAQAPLGPGAVGHLGVRMQVLCGSLAVAGAGFPSASRKLPPPLVRCSCALPSRTRLPSVALFVVVIVCFIWARCGCVCGSVDRPYSRPGQVAASHIVTRQHTVMLPPPLRLMMCQAVPTSVCL
jgi:hypothetical protein